MSKNPEYQKTRESFGIGVLGTTMVEVEAEDGTAGFALTTGGVPAAWLIEHHFKRFVVRKTPDDTEIMFDQMYNASLFYGRKGLTINAISAVDCAVWNLRGRLRGDPFLDLIDQPRCLSLCEPIRRVDADAQFLHSTVISLPHAASS